MNWRAILRNPFCWALALLLLMEFLILTRGPQPADHLPAIEEAMARDGRPDWWHDAAMGLRLGAWIGLAGWGLLLLTSPLWTRSFVAPAPSSGLFPAKAPRWFWPLVLVAVLCGLGLRLPLASKSLWWDEAWVAQQVTHGKWREDAKKPGTLKFQAHDWKRCAFYYQKPTNHVPMSLAQKLGLNAWRKVSGATRSEFNDLAARLPALLASALAIGLIAALLRSWGRPGAGVAAALVLAVHPWAIRHGVDARAYALVIPLCLLGMLCVTRIVAARGRGAWAWVGFGFTEWIWLWAYPNAVFDIAALNLVTLGFLLVRQTNHRDRWTAWWRLAATNVFAALCVIQFFLPNLAQARHWAGQEKDKHFLDAALANQTAANLLAGLDHSNPGTGMIETQGIPYLDSRYMAASLLVAVLGALALRAGVRKLRHSRPLPVVLLASMLLASLLFAITTRVAETYFYPRFIIAVLPCLIVVAVLAAGTSPTRQGTRPWPWWAALAALYLWVIWPGLALLTTRPIAPLRDVAEYIQRAEGNDSSPPLVVCYGLGREALPLYERRSIAVDTAQELEKVIQQAQAEKRPLYAVYGYSGFNRQLLGDGFRFLDDRTLFTEVAAFPGIDKDFYFRVLKMP